MHRRGQVRGGEVGEAHVVMGLRPSVNRGSKPPRQKGSRAIVKFKHLSILRSLQPSYWQIL